jgi:hypothetical protein
VEDIWLTIDTSKAINGSILLRKGKKNFKVLAV